jgi:4-alpha-glucanotransferase
VDWLVEAGQSWWQVLPLGPPDEYGSPYASPSAFAGSPGLLADPESPVTGEEIDRFREREAYWAADWEAFGGQGQAALADQVRFEREWSALRRYANERGVRLIGDVPIYVSGGSADVAAHPELFQPGDVAGAPPDPMNLDGQHWGNPLYDWDAMRRDGYCWWIERLRRTFALVDLTRIDHFRGFAEYWAVPPGANTARIGHWLPGPGEELFRAAERELGPLPLIAEDLGVITPDVYELRDRLGFPGMVVMHWAFGPEPDNPHALANHHERLVVYTGTHDTDTTVGWFRSLPKRERDRTGLDPDEPSWSLIELGYSSPARLAIVPMQDVLGLGSEHRMNRPGEAEGNWAWRLEPGQPDASVAARLRGLAERNHRV